MALTIGAKIIDFSRQSRLRKKSIEKPHCGFCGDAISLSLHRYIVSIVVRHEALY